MATIRKVLTLQARADDVWDAVRDFGGVHKRLGPGFLLDAHWDGDARVVTFFNNMVVREPLVTLDDVERRLVYTATGGMSRHYNAVMEVFIVSFVTSTISAMVVLLSGAYVSGLTSTAAVAYAFNQTVPTVGGWVVAFCVFLFGYTTLIGWAFYGEQFLEYIFGPAVVKPYRWIYCLLIPLGAISKVELVWAWGDLMNALQIFPNIIGVLGLSGLVAKIARERNAA